MEKINTHDTVITLCDVGDGDWKTQLARGYDNIPAGTELEIIGTLDNLYGHWLRTNYHGHTYSINPNKVKLVKRYEFGS